MRISRCIALAIAAALLAGVAHAADKTKADEAAVILMRLKNHELGPWEASIQLEKLGPDAAPAIEEKINALPSEQRIPAARALCGMGSLPLGVKTLVGIITEAPASKAALDAASLLGKWGRGQAEGDLMSLLDKMADVPLRIALAKSLHAAARSEEAWQKANVTLLEIFKTARGEDRKECALALADTGDFGPGVVAVLEELQVEPSHRGGYAQALLDIRKLRETTSRHVRAGAKFNDPILNEVFMELQTHHVEEPKTFEELRDAAAKGMAGAFDPFTSYYDSNEYRQFQESMKSEYAGIGARVGFLGDASDPADRIFCVIRPIYSGPAYKAGIRSYDIIVKVNGEPTAGKELDKLVESLKGAPDTEVEVTVKRCGDQAEKVFKIKREVIKMQSVHHKMLPGSIGYVRLTQFVSDSAEEFFTAITELEGKGMRALIFDLRNNPGGLLQAAVQVSDGFLKNDKLIVRSVGRDPRMEERFMTHDPATHPDYPIVILVNGASASASEIVAGALQDHKRAVLVGERTYGKGSVQRLFDIKADGKKSAIKVTIAKYYLPSGRSIHRTRTDRGGVKPDIEVKQESRIDSRDSGRFEEIRRAGSFDAYTLKHLRPNLKLFEEIADFDCGNTERYPDFDAWYESLTVPISKESARIMLREWIKVKLGDELGVEAHVDTQDDDQLGRAVVECMIRLGEKNELEKVEQYKGMLRRFKLDK